MAPKKKPAAEAAPAATPPPKKRPASEGTVDAKKRNTTSARAAAAGVEAIERTPTPRKPTASAVVQLLHWNVGGLNGLLKDEKRRGLLTSLIEAEKPDVLAISEHKIAQAKLEDADRELRALVPGYELHWAVCTVKNGYSGVVCLVRDGLALVGKPCLDTVLDLSEGRTITLEFAGFHAVAAYVPNSGMDLKRLDLRIDSWEPAMIKHLKKLEATGKPVVLFGDLNVAHLDADIWNAGAKHLAKSAGTTPQEREAFGRLLEAGPYVDCFRHFWPEATGCFSYWSTRSGNQLLNRGLRLDYAVASQAIAEGSGSVRLHDCAILDGYAPNGDHAPTLVALRGGAK